jgi:hypothetical protein
MRYQKPDRCFREHSSCKRRTERELGRKAKREVEEGVICFWFYLSLFFIGCFIRHLAITRMKLNTNLCYIDSDPTQTRKVPMVLTS